MEKFPERLEIHSSREIEKLAEQIRQTCILLDVMDMRKKEMNRGGQEYKWEGGSL